MAAEVVAAAAAAAEGAAAAAVVAAEAGVAAILGAAEAAAPGRPAEAVAAVERSGTGRDGATPRPAARPARAAGGFRLRRPEPEFLRASGYRAAPRRENPEGPATAPSPETMCASPIPPRACRAEPSRRPATTANATRCASAPAAERDSLRGRSSISSGSSHRKGRQDRQRATRRRCSDPAGAGWTTADHGPLQCTTAIAPSRYAA